MKRNDELFFPALFGESYAARRLSFGALMMLLLLAALIALNTCLGWLPFHIAFPDVTDSETFRLSGVAKDWLEGLDEPITLYLVCAGGEATADADLYAFLQAFSGASDLVSVKILDSQKNTAALSAYGANGIEDHSVIVASAKRHRVIANGELYYYYYPYSSGGGTTLSAEEYRYMLEYWSANDPTGSYVAQLASSVIAYFDGGSRVINAINYVLADRIANAYLVTGGSGLYPDAAFCRSLSSAGYTLNRIDSVTSLPTVCDLLILYAPTSDISAEEAERLSDYLEKGGKLFLLSSLTKTPERLNAVLSAYGMTFEESTAVVCDSNPNSMTMEGSPYLFRAQIQSKNEATGDFAESFVVYSAHSIAVTEAEGVTVAPWLYTTQAGYLDDADESTPIPEKRSYSVGVTAQKDETRIVWLSCAHSLTEAVDAPYAEGNNTVLAIYGMNWLTGVKVDAVDVSPTVIDTSVLSVSYGGFIFWSLVMVLLLPAGIIVGGAVVTHIRKKR